MKNRIYYPSSDKTKSVYLNHDFLYIASKAFNKPEDFTEAFKNPKNYDHITKFELQDIKKISILPDEVILKALIKEEGEPYTAKMKFNESDQLNFIHDLGRISGLEKKISTQNPLKGALDKIGLTILFGALSYFLANGMTFDPDGGSTIKTRFGAKILYTISSFLGPTLTLVLFIVATIFFAYLTWKKFKSPAKLIVFSHKNQS